MQLSGRRGARKKSCGRALWLVATLCLWVARDAPAHALVEARGAAETPLAARARAERVDSWTRELGPVDVESVRTRNSARVLLYTASGEVDEESRAAFERIANDGDAHELAPRLEQLVVKAAYHYQRAKVLIVSGWRENAGRHTAGEAIDFKLAGVGAAQLAAYLRSLPRTGVGIYTHPHTQFVHLDVRETSYHWIDASAPGTRGREWPLADKEVKKRDAAYLPAMDLPL